METVFYVLIAILATAGTYTIVKIIYCRLVIIADQIKIKRKRIAKIDTLWNSVKHMDGQLSDIGRKTDTHQETLNSIDREMDAFHGRIVKDFQARLDEAGKKVTKRLDNISKRIYEITMTATPYKNRVKKLEEANKNCNDLHLTHAHMISALEEAQGIQKDRFDNVLNLKNIKVKG